MSHSHSPLHYSTTFKCVPYFKLRKATPRGNEAATGTTAPDLAVPAPVAGPWTLPDLCSAYNWPKNLAGGGVIAIVELGGGWVQSDMD